MYLEAMAQPPFRALTTSATDSSFASRVPTNTEPSGNGVIDICSQGALAPWAVQFWPFGLGDDNDVFDLRLWGWYRYGNNPGTLLWVPTLLAQVTCTMCAVTGAAGMLIAATERFCDTITIGHQPKKIDADSGGAASSGTLEISSPTNDLIAFGIVPLLGCQKLQLDFDMTTNDPTNANALLAYRTPS